MNLGTGPRAERRRRRCDQHDDAQRAGRERRDVVGVDRVLHAVQRQRPVRRRRLRRVRNRAHQRPAVAGRSRLGRDGDRGDELLVSEVVLDAHEQNTWCCACSFVALLRVHERPGRPLIQEAHHRDRRRPSRDLPQRPAADGLGYAPAEDAAAERAADAEPRAIHGRRLQRRGVPDRHAAHRRVDRDAVAGAQRADLCPRSLSPDDHRDRAARASDRLDQRRLPVGTRACSSTRRRATHRARSSSSTAARGSPGPTSSRVAPRRRRRRTCL